MKKLTKAMGIVGSIMILICAVVLGLFATTAYAFTDNLSLSERELYNATNTYNVNGSHFDESGKIKVVPETNRVTETDQYHISYDMSAKNGNKVMSNTQVTVLTHGLGGSARHWSNDFSEK